MSERRRYMVEIDTTGRGDTIDDELVRALRLRFGRLTVHTARVRLDDTWTDDTCIAAPQSASERPAPQV